MKVGEFVRLQVEIDFSLCPTLERVVVPVVAHTTIDGTGVSLYFDDHAIYGIGRMLPSWARVSKIWFDPQMKELQKLGLENISELCLEFDRKTELVESFTSTLSFDWDSVAESCFAFVFISASKAALFGLNV